MFLLVNLQVSFYKKWTFSQYLQGRCPYFRESFLISLCLKMVIFDLCHKEMEFFLTLLNAWNLLTNVTKSSNLDIVGVLDTTLVSDICD